MLAAWRIVLAPTPSRAISAYPAQDARSRAAKLAEKVAVVAAWIKLFIESGSITELRAIEVKAKFGRPYTVSGFFDCEHIERAAQAAFHLTPDAKGVYFVPNPIDPQLLARRMNRIDRAGDGELTTDRNITRRRWLYIDIDPARDAKISACDEEKALAWEMILAVREFLRGRGWPDPILGDSGNGYHLDYRIDLPADDGRLVARVLLAPSRRFGTGQVKIDLTVFNPARVMKFYGTFALKGDNAPQLKRVHRASKLLEIPGCSDPCDLAQLSAVKMQTVPDELLEMLAAENGTKATGEGGGQNEEKQPPPGPSPSTNGAIAPIWPWLLVSKWLAARNINFRKKDTLASDNRTVFLITCPFDPSHTGGDTCIMQAPDGKLSAHCFHASCAGRDWQQFKEKIGKPDPDHYDPPLNSGASQDANAFHYTPLNASEFANTDYKLEWLLDVILKCRSASTRGRPLDAVPVSYLGWASRCKLSTVRCAALEIDKATGALEQHAMRYKPASGPGTVHPTLCRCPTSRYSWRAPYDSCTLCFRVTPG